VPQRKNRLFRRSRRRPSRWTPQPRSLDEAEGIFRSATVSVHQRTLRRGRLIGVALSLALAKALSGIVLGADVFDPRLFAGMAIALVAAVALASYLPAGRAARTDPVVALRAD
jgi:hypothetical protein